MATELSDRIIETIDRLGPITFAQYMQLALYDPQEGFYSGGKVNISADGKTGDFSTHPEISSPHFGGSIASLASRIDDEHSLDHIIVLGDGNGTLSSDMMDYLKKLNPELYDSVSLEVVDISPPLLKKQQQKLKSRGHSANFHNISAVEFPFEDYPNAFVVANELLDNFPGHRLIENGDGFDEVYVAHDNGSLKMITGPLSADALMYVERARAMGRSLEITSFLDGDEVIANPNLIRLMDRMSKSDSIAFLTIDYGSYQHPNSSIQIYENGHRLHWGPFLSPGDLDITYGVDFNMLLGIGEFDFRFFSSNYRLFMNRIHWQQDFNGFPDYLHRDLTLGINPQNVAFVARGMDVPDIEKLIGDANELNKGEFTFANEVQRAIEKMLLQRDSWKGEVTKYGGRTERFGLYPNDGNDGPFDSIYIHYNGDEPYEITLNFRGQGPMEMSRIDLRLGRLYIENEFGQKKEANILIDIISSLARDLDRVHEYDSSQNIGERMERMMSSSLPHVM